MSSLGEPWDEATPGSASKKNITSVITTDGDTAAGLDKAKFKLIALNADGAAGDTDDLLMTNAAADAFINLRQVAAHTHTNSTDGGTIAAIADSNWLWVDFFLSRTTDLQKANWIQTVTSSGTIEDATDGTTGERSIRLRPNGTSGSGSTISYPHISLDFSKAAYYETKVRIETATSLAFHTGVGADDVTAADSNTRKFNAEICTATNSNWFLRTANGSANSSSDTGVAISTSRTWLYIAHSPTTPETDLYIDDNAVFQKTTHIPIDQSSAHINLIKHSIKNSTPADRPIHIYPTRVKYFMTDKWV